MQIDLTNHIAVVTGGGGYLGRVICKTLAGCGAAVAVGYRSSKDESQAVVDHIKQTGGKAMLVQVDVGDEQSVYAMRDAIEQTLGSADIVVTNAVQQINPWQTVLQESTEDYESQFRTCVMQNVYMAKAFVPAMQKNGWGRYIGINTECTMRCDVSSSAYVSGKGGMDRMLRVLAREIGEHGITVNQVAPGWTMTDRFRVDGKDVDPGEAYTQKLPLKRRNTDEDIANAVIFLASDLAKAITGVYLPVCSGNVMPTV